MIWRDRILNHFWLKLFSVVLATLIWLAISANISKSDATRDIAQCPVLLMTSASDHRAYKVEPNQVTVTVRGPVGTVEQIRDSDIHVYVQSNAPRRPSGEVTVEVHAPRGINVWRVVPPSVTVKLLEQPVIPP